MTRRRSVFHKTRGTLYTLARVLGDLNAIQRGTMGKRLARRVVGRATGRAMWKLFR